MTKSRRIFLLAGAVLAATGAHAASAAVIAQWAFTSTAAAPVNSPAATTDNSGGTALATSLGMTNGYVYANGEGPGSLTNDDITSVTGATSGVTEDGWRIRGNGNTKNSGAGVANGWNNSAPNYTQGAEFSVSTAGYTNVDVSFDWYSTTQGVGNMQVRYSLDGTSFTNLGSDYIAVSGDFYGATKSGAPSPDISVDLSAIPGASNDPNFAIEFVSVRPVSGDPNYSTTGPGGDGNYASAAGGDYNNNSGNWSFNNITISGTAALPEPASLSVLGLAGLAMLGRRRNKKA